MMKSLYDNVSYKLSELLTKNYSTSFSLGIRFLSSELRPPVYAIYGFVRLADEIVDTFHDYDKQKLFRLFKESLDRALEDKISVNPLLNSFQQVVFKYNIEKELIDAFLFSMEMDLNQYVLGSAEVVGLMCLRIFTEGSDEEYQKLKPFGMKLGAAYQKINFLRDLKADYDDMGRTYFPKVDLDNFHEKDKKFIEREIDQDFMKGLEGIKMLPDSSKMGVYLSFVYYYKLFQKIRTLSAEKVKEKRVRISNFRKFLLLFITYIRFKLGLV